MSNSTTATDSTKTMLQSNWDMLPAPVQESMTAQGYIVIADPITEEPTVSIDADISPEFDSEVFGAPIEPENEEDAPAKDTEGFYLNIGVKYGNETYQIGVKLNTDFYTKHFDAAKKVEDRADNIDVLNLIDDMREYGADMVMKHIEFNASLNVQGQSRNKVRRSIMAEILEAEAVAVEQTQAEAEDSKTSAE